MIKSPKFKVSLEIRGNLFTVTLYKVKIKKQIPTLQHNMAQKMHYHPEGEEMAHREEMPGPHMRNEQQVTLQTLHLHV